MGADTERAARTALDPMVGCAAVAVEEYRVDLATWLGRGLGVGLRLGVGVGVGVGVRVRVRVGVGLELGLGTYS